MDTYFVYILLCIVQRISVNGQMLVSHKAGVIITASSQYGDVFNISNAVDWNARTDAYDCRCCGATQFELNPWYRVYLIQEYMIQRIHVQGRTDLPHTLNKMEIQLGITESNGTVLQGVATSANTRIDKLDHTLISPELARFITLTLPERSHYFVICELYIYAVCSGGLYGPECVNTCDECQTEPCDSVTGECPVCTSGYQSPLCKDCIAGRYGSTCEICGQCNSNDVCNNSSGNCPNGCSAGYQGTKCKQECSLGYGLDCAETCGNCENNAACNTLDGACTACKYGYISPLCKVCKDGRYGTTCNEDCGHCNNTDVCDKSNGDCPNGCSAGYKGATCKEECQPGTYGFNCIQHCAMCLDEDVCDIYTGECPRGCTDGYKGSQCSQEMNQDTSPCSDNTCISIPVFIGSLFAVIVVNTTSGLLWLLYRNRLHKKTHKAANSEDTSNRLPNIPSNYDTLKFENPGGESTYTELNRRS